MKKTITQKILNIGLLYAALSLAYGRSESLGEPHPDYGAPCLNPPKLSVVWIKEYVVEIPDQGQVQIIDMSDLPECIRKRMVLVLETGALSIINRMAWADTATLLNWKISLGHTSNYAMKVFRDEPEKAAITRLVSQGLAVTYLNPAFLKTIREPALIVILMHEAIHAWLLVQYEKQDQTDQAHLFNEDYIRSLVVFRENVTHHERGFDTFMASMAQGLKTALLASENRDKYQRFLAKKRNQHYCQDLAWLGLNHTHFFKRLIPTRKDQERITHLIEKESYGYITVYNRREKILVFSESPRFDCAEEYGTRRH
ncbi:MAG: hypothetical protein HC880_13895 [Bacteroidia bacterium]|nr:hypothetical protein [Bacteroidia bacterium]